MVNVPVNDNIDSYKNTVFMGLTPRQTVSLMVAVVLGTVEFLLIYFLLHLDLMVCSLIIIPTVGVVVMAMNYEKDGLNLMETIQTGRYKKNAEVLYYESTETILNYGDAGEERPVTLEEQTAKKEEEFEKMTRILVIAMVAGVILMAGVAVGLVAYMSR